MDFSARLQALSQLGDFLRSDYAKVELGAVLHQAELQNPWFSVEQSKFAIEQIAQQFLDSTALQNWTKDYPFLPEKRPMRRIGLVLAGNIPAVGFHDILCCFVAGQQALIKYSDKDKVLIPFLLEQLALLAPPSRDYFKVMDRLVDFDAVIATGSDNSSRYFEHYFGAYPHIIRKNRNSVVLLSGEETEEELRALSEDIFRYFGLGCRSVSKIYVPQNFDFPRFMRIMDDYSQVMEHYKYKNNFDYNRAVYLLNNVQHWANDSLTLVEDPSLLSRISTLHYEFYKDLGDLKQKIDLLQPQLQAVVGRLNLEGIKMVDWGKSQIPSLSDYADGVDTIAFLASLSTVL